MLKRFMVTQIIGPEGSGKTTMAIALANLLAANGRVVLYGEGTDALLRQVYGGSCLTASIDVRKTSNFPKDNEGSIFHGVKGSIVFDGIAPQGVEVDQTVTVEKHYVD